MFLFQTIYGKSQSNVPNESNTSKIISSARDFVISKMHIKPEQYEGIINKALTSIMDNSPKYYKSDGRTAFSLDYVVPGNMQLMLKEIYSGLLSDTDTKEVLYKKFVVDSKLVKHENFEDFFKGHAALAALLMIQHAQNFKEDIKSVGFSGQMAHICSSSICVVFDIMEEVKKVAPELFSFGKSIHPPTVNLPQKTLEGLGGLASRIGSNVEIEYNNIFGKGSYAKLESSMEVWLRKAFQEFSIQNNLLKANEGFIAVKNPVQEAYGRAQLFRTQQDSLIAEEEKAGEIAKKHRRKGGSDFA